MREQKWLELKIPKRGWESLQENETGDLLNTSSGKQNTPFETIEGTGMIDDEVEDNKVEKHLNQSELAIVAESSDDESDKVSENANILPTDMKKLNFLQRRKIHIIIFLFVFVFIFIMMLFQVSFLWVLKDQKITHNISIYSLYDIIWSAMTLLNKELQIKHKVSTIAGEVLVYILLCAGLKITEHVLNPHNDINSWSIYPANFIYGGT